MLNTALAEALEKAREENLKPPPNLDVPEWSDEYRYVAKENSANPGRWKTRTVPVAYGPMLAVTEKDTQVVSLMACTQLVKTEFLQNVACYFIHQDPASILYVLPTQKLAQSFSKDRFSKTVANTPVLQQLLGSSKSRDSENTIVSKSYPGGSLDFVGANSAVDLASRPKRVVLADEIDLFPPDAGGMGDPLALAEERSSTFRNRRIHVRVCSPSAESTSRIYAEYLLSDQRRCFVRCPHCGEEQTLHWSRETIIWEKDEDGNHLVNTVKYCCSKCAKAWSEAERRKAIRALAEIDEPHKGWKQTKPFKCCGKTHDPMTWDGKGYWDDNGRSYCPECGVSSHYEGHAGFHVSKLYSTRHDMGEVVQEYLNSYKIPSKYQKWLNTALAEVTKDQIEKISPEGLESRREVYSYTSLPERIRFLTAGVDTQDDRLEMQILGHGMDGEVWVVRYVVIYGDTEQEKVWRELDAELRETYYREDGKLLRIQATGIDSQGHRTQQVYDYCRARRARRVFALRGVGNKQFVRPIWPVTGKRSKKSQQLRFDIGVDTAKDLVATLLSNEPNYDGKPKPYSVHFPDDGLPPDYFDQLTAEQAVINDVNGIKVRNWEVKEEGIRNEALDTFVYGLAVAYAVPGVHVSNPAIKQGEAKKTKGKKPPKAKGQTPRPPNPKPEPKQASPPKPPAAKPRMIKLPRPSATKRQ